MCYAHGGPSSTTAMLSEMVHIRARYLAQYDLLATHSRAQVSGAFDWPDEHLSGEEERSGLLAEGAGALGMFGAG